MSAASEPFVELVALATAWEAGEPKGLALVPHDAATLRLLGSVLLPLLAAAAPGPTAPSCPVAPSSEQAREQGFERVIAALCRAADEVVLSVSPLEAFGLLSVVLLATQEECFVKESPTSLRYAIRAIPHIARRLSDLIPPDVRGPLQQLEEEGRGAAHHFGRAVVQRARASGRLVAMRRVAAGAASGPNAEAAWLVELLARELPAGLNARDKADAKKGIESELQACAWASSFAAEAPRS